MIVKNHFHYIPISMCRWKWANYQEILLPLPVANDWVHITIMHDVSPMQALLSVNAGQSSEQLLPEVVKLLADVDLVTKKLAHEYITQPGHNEELLLLAVNTLLRDCRNANPTVRGLAIKTITSLSQV